jgi:hypothetical protein
MAATMAVDGAGPRQRRLRVNVGRSRPIAFSVDPSTTFAEVAAICQEKINRIFKGEKTPLSRVATLLVDGCLVDDSDTIESIEPEEGLCITAVFEEDVNYFQKLEKMSRAALIHEITQLRAEKCDIPLPHTHSSNSAALCAHGTSPPPPMSQSDSSSGPIALASSAMAWRPSEMGRLKMTRSDPPTGRWAPTSRQSSFTERGLAPSDATVGRASSAAEWCISAGAMAGGKGLDNRSMSDDTKNVVNELSLPHSLKVGLLTRHARTPLASQSSYSSLAFFAFISFNNVQ